MIIRIVRMHFKDDGVAAFLEIFNAHKEKIRHFPGCAHLELVRDANNPAVFATLSHWQHESDLESYRNSSLFEAVWGNVKPLMAERTLAFSFEKFIEV